jgi:nicotinamide-nucleotide amidase
MGPNEDGRVCRAHLFLRALLALIGEGAHGTPYALLSLILSSVAWSQPASTDDSGNKPASQPVRYMIVITGDELLAGAYPDGHTFFLTRTLRPLGLQCVGSLFVDDSQADVKEALRFAAGKATLILVTGGLGPTDNDITRAALRDFTGIALQEHPDVLAAMAKRFNVPAAELRANLRQQTQVPVQGTYLKNSSGTAVGLVFEMPDRVIVALPGPPRELQPMVRDELVPYLSRRFGVRPPGASLTLRFVGLGQSQIDQMLKDHVPLPADVMTSSQFEGSRVDFMFSLPRDTPEDRARLQELKIRILEHLSDNIYAEDEATSLEDCVVKLLAARGHTLAVAEVGSGGALAAALNGAKDAQRVLAGAHVAPTPERLRHLLGIREGSSGRNQTGAQEAQQFARAAAEEATSPWAVAVGEVRRADGGSFVEAAFRLPDGRVESHPVRVQGSDASGRARLTTDLLDQLRRRLRQGAPNAK